MLQERESVTKVHQATRRRSNFTRCTFMEWLLLSGSRNIFRTCAHRTRGDLMFRCARSKIKTLSAKQKSTTNNTHRTSCTIEQQNNPSPNMSQQHEQRVARAKKSCKIPLDTSVVPKELYDEVLKCIVSNVKMGPFKATSGVELAYYLNASTNFLDKNAAPKIVEIMAVYIEHYIRPLVTKIEEQPFLCVGMEVAGGMLVCQLASAGHSTMNALMDYTYIRKDRKLTGTQQQLEGPLKYTSRTANSPVLKALWVDDALSTGSSMLDGIKLLKREYNIEVVAALYLVDRSADRANLGDQYQKLADEAFDNIQVFAIYDLQEVDEIVHQQKTAK